MENKQGPVMLAPEFEIKFTNRFGRVELWYQGLLVRQSEMGLTTGKGIFSKSDIVEKWRKEYGAKFYDPNVAIKTILYKKKYKIKPWQKK